MGPCGDGTGWRLEGSVLKQFVSICWGCLCMMINWPGRRIWLTLQIIVEFALEFRCYKLFFQRVELDRACSTRLLHYRTFTPLQGIVDVAFGFRCSDLFFQRVELDHAWLTLQAIVDFAFESRCSN